MQLTGAEIIHLSGRQAEARTQLKPRSQVSEVQAPAHSESSLERGTEDALKRFARFIHKRGPVTPPGGSSLPAAYQTQLGNAHRSGEFLNIYV